MLHEVQHFFNAGMMLQSWNRTFIILILKKENPKLTIDFRSISLCNTTYKCVAKVLVNNLQSILPSIIYMEQSAFVHGREIAHNIPMAQELMHYMEN